MIRSTMQQKGDLRKAIKRKLRALDPLQAGISSQAICRQVKGLAQFRQANTIFAFVGVGWEIDTKSLLLSAWSSGKRVAVPYCTAPGIMEARLIRGLDDLVPGAYDIPAPKETCPVCPPEEIDFAVIPCISCDPTCKRLGQGGGFYDRFLEGAAFANAAVCRDIAMVEAIPSEPWDQPVDCVVTETNIYYRHKHGEAQA